MSVRPAGPGDIEALARVWHEAWHDAHAKLAPPGLVAARTLASFRSRLEARQASGTMLVFGDPAVGFVDVKGDELEQLMVARGARGTGAAAALMEAATQRLRAAGVRTAWLHCATGNDRARRFYERQGWHVAREEDARLPVEGAVFALPCWRMEREL